MTDIKTNVLIVEDEFSIALDIEMRLKKMNYNVVGIANSYKDSLSILLENKIDVALLDINLNSSKSGIDIAEIINDKFDIPILFITAYSDSKTFSQALSVKPMGFITKPFKDEDLNHNIQLAITNFSKRIIDDTKETMQDFTLENNNLFIKDKGIYKKIRLEEIYWAEAMDNYTIIHTKTNKYIVSAFLKDVITKLGSNFLRIHRSHAVALDKISSIEDNLVYIDKTMLIVSQTYKQDLLKRLNIL
ncbi:MAG: response regulator [Bacteroidales bacterium]|nr:response regulator [Bacteroidales bacterium]